MPTGWTEVTIGAESVRAYVQDTAGPVEVHAPPGTKAAPGTAVQIAEAHYVVRGTRNPGDRGEVTIIELMTEAEAQAAREAAEMRAAVTKPPPAESAAPAAAKRPARAPGKKRAKVGR